MTTTPTREPRTPAVGGWFKSSWSSYTGECVEIKFDHPDGLVHIRDSKDRGTGPVISVTSTQRAILLDELTTPSTLRSSGAARHGDISGRSGARGVDRGWRMGIGAGA
jgi:hypothetical protein